MSNPAWRRRWYAATYTTSGFRGSSTTSVMPVFSLICRTAFHVWPPSEVLYKPRSPPADHSGPCTATHTTSLLRGSIVIRPIFSERSNPTRFHVAPASVLLNTPSPADALRRLVFSPVASHTTFELRGSTSTQHME